MLAILEYGKLEISVTNDEIYSLVISISIGETNFEQIVEWLKQNTKTL